MKIQSVSSQLSKEQRKSRRKRRFFRTITIIVGFLIIVRIAAPVVILRMVNKKLETLPNYICTLKDFDISILTKSITLKGIVMKKRNGKIEIPFFTANQIHVNLESFKDRTSKIVVDSCVLNFVRGKNKEESQFKVDKELVQMGKEMPLKPNIFIVNNAEVHFIEKYRSPDINLSIKQISVDARNIENQSKSLAEFPATIAINGIFEGGKLKADAKLNKQLKKPLVNLIASFTPINVVKIKNFLKVYASLNVESGTLSATSIINIKNGRVDGFIDPTAKSLVFHESSKKSDVKLIKRIKQRALNIASKILGKGEADKIETRIELHGKMSEVKVNVWDIIIDGLKQSFLAGNQKE